MWPLTVWSGECFALFGLDKFSGSWVTISLPGGVSAWLWGDEGEAADASMRKHMCKKKPERGRQRPKQSDMHDTRTLFLILRSVIPTCVCSWSGIHANDHRIISDTRHGLWRARHSGYGCCGREKMEDSGMRKYKRHLKWKQKWL